MLINVPVGVLAEHCAQLLGLGHAALVCFVTGEGAGVEQAVGGFHFIKSVFLAFGGVVDGTRPLFLR